MRALRRTLLLLGAIPGAAAYLVWLLAAELDLPADDHDRADIALDMLPWSAAVVGVTVGALLLHAGRDAGSGLSWSLGAGALHVVYALWPLWYLILFCHGCLS